MGFQPKKASVKTSDVKPPLEKVVLISFVFSILALIGSVYLTLSIDRKIQTAVFNYEHKHFMVKTCKEIRDLIDVLHPKESEQEKRLLMGESCVKFLYDGENQTP